MRRRVLASLGGGWKNPYVTDGLVAMWDGEWNAGGGVHDPNATAWKDIAGNEPDIVGSVLPLSFGKNYLSQDAFCGAINASSGSLFGNVTFTLEVVFRNNGMNSNSYAISNGVPGSTYGTGVTTGGYGSYTSRKVRIFIGATSTDLVSNVRTNDDVSVSVARSIESGYAKAYVNGIFDSDLAIGTNVYTNMRLYFYSSVSWSRFYSIRIYSKTLTPAEVAANYAIDKARFNLA